jgi:hypothetical protein
MLQRGVFSSRSDTASSVPSSPLAIIHHANSRCVPITYDHIIVVVELKDSTGRFHLTLLLANHDDNEGLALVLLSTALLTTAGRAALRVSPYDVGATTTTTTSHERHVFSGSSCI